MITAHPTVRQVMTRELVTARERTPFKELVWLLKSHSISALPIVDGAGKLVGIVSETDLLVKEQHAGGELPNPSWLFESDRVDALIARDLMTWPVLTVRASATIARAAHTMQEFGVRHLVVVAGGRPTGIVSRSDLLNVYLRPDAEIRQQVIYGVADEMLSIDPASISVEVKDGVVTLAGQLADFANADLLVSVVRRLPGVIGVQDRLRAGKGRRPSGGWPYEPPPDVDSIQDKEATT
jgi:CBS domain-containing protein